MKNIKASFALLLLGISICAFIELFNVHNNEQVIWFLLATFNMSAILSYLLIKSAYND